MWHLLALANTEGTKDTESDTRTEHEVLKEGGIGETCLKDRKGKQLAGDVDQ